MKKKSKVHVAKRSEIIEQCVIYAQSIAAYQAGFKVDSTGNFDYAGADKGQCGRRHERRADRALLRLLALSNVNVGDKLPTIEELSAKTRVLSIIGMQTDEYTHPEKFEGAYIRLFAGELDRYFREAIENAARAERSKADVGTAHQANA